MSESDEQVLNGYRFKKHALDRCGVGWGAAVTYAPPIQPVDAQRQLLRVSGTFATEQEAHNAALVAIVSRIVRG